MLQTTKPADHPIHKTYAKGIEAQEFLKSVIEEHLGEEITGTPYVYDTMDFTSENYCIELKRRFKPYNPSDWFMKDGWLIPACKIFRAREESRKTRFYYYFDSDESLWYWDYNQEEADKCMCKVPKNHRDNQLHYYLPQTLWKLIQ